jgi:hypothetical protein
MWYNDPISKRSWYFYVRYPIKKQVKLPASFQRVLIVEGDGVQLSRILLQQNPDSDAVGSLTKEYGAKLSTVLASGRK